jgi:hypothetical protein
VEKNRNEGTCEEMIRRNRAVPAKPSRYDPTSQVLEVP